MKGVVLAGGLGTRLRPLTNVLNKHLLPVYDRPMLSYALELMAAVAVDDVMIVLGGHGMEQVTRFVKDGRAFGLRGVNYTYQEGEGGIAAALALTERWVGPDRVFVVLGDNIVLDTKEVARQVRKASAMSTPLVWLSEVANPGDYGCPVFSGSILERIEEKTTEPKSPYAAVGMYLYSCDVFPIINSLAPSARNELEISDVNNVYAAQGRLGYRMVEDFWADAGSSIDGYLATCNAVKAWKAKPEPYPELLNKG